MGKRGPRKTPTKLQLVRGETKAGQVNRNEPVPPELEVEAPDFLGPDARAVWDQYAPGLRSRGLLSVWDVPAFAVLCEAIVHHREACQIIDGTSVLVAGDKGRLVKNPALQVARDQALTVRQFAGEFGMTPAARAGIDAGELRLEGRGGADLLSG